MDQETKYALAGVYRDIKHVAEMAYEARRTAESLRAAAYEVAPEFEEAFHRHYHSAKMTEIALAAAHLQVSIDAVIRRLEGGD